MDFAFSDEQEMLRASARELLTDAIPIERVVAIAEAGASADDEVRSGWRRVIDAGWAGISVPEDEGGAGLSFQEEIILCEEMGRTLYPGPFLASVVLALPILRTAGASDLVGSVVSGERIATAAWFGAERDDDAFAAPVSWDGERLTCTRLFVPNLSLADVVVVIGRSGDDLAAWAVDADAPGVRREDLPTVDRTRRFGELTVEAAPARLLVEGADAEVAVRHMRVRALAALAAEACGVAADALGQAVGYASTRTQFGRPIGSFQAVAHQLAGAYLDLETSRSLTYWAGWAVAEAAPEADGAAAAAKARAADAAVRICEASIQAHGGIGFTWEHPLHRLYKRALAIASSFGTADELWAAVADDVLVPAASP